jgi:hypothetical protein
MSAGSHPEGAAATEGPTWPDVDGSIRNSVCEAILHSEDGMAKPKQTPEFSPALLDAFAADLKTSSPATWATRPASRSPRTQPITAMGPRPRRS